MSKDKKKKDDDDDDTVYGKIIRDSLPRELIAAGEPIEEKKGVLWSVLSRLSLCGTRAQKRQRRPSYDEFRRRLAAERDREERKSETASAQTNTLSALTNVTALSFSSAASKSIKVTTDHQKRVHFVYNCSLYVVNDQTHTELRYKPFAENIEVKLTQLHNKIYRIQSTPHFDEEIDLENSIIEYLSTMVFWKSYAFKFRTSAIASEFYAALVRLGKPEKPYLHEGYDEIVSLACRIYRHDTKTWQLHRLGRVLLILHRSFYHIMVISDKYRNFHAIIPLSKIIEFDKHAHDAVFIKWSDKNDAKSIKLQFITREDDYFYKKIKAKLSDILHSDSSSGYRMSSKSSITNDSISTTVSSSRRQDSISEILEQMPTATICDPYASPQSGVMPTGQIANLIEATTAVPRANLSSSPTSDTLTSQWTNSQDPTATTNADTSLLYTNYDDPTADAASSLDDADTLTLTAEEIEATNEFIVDVIKIEAKADKLVFSQTWKNQKIQFIQSGEKYYFRIDENDHEIDLSQQFIGISDQYVSWSCLRFVTKDAQLHQKLHYAGLYKEPENLDCHQGKTHYVAQVEIEGKTPQAILCKLEFLKNPTTKHHVLEITSANNAQGYQVNLSNGLKMSTLKRTHIVLEDQINRIKVKLVILEEDANQFRTHLARVSNKK